MEFPYLGEHCHMKQCNRLDFLPIKCSACSQIFCSDHYQFSNHSCANENDGNNQAPVCPMCNKPLGKKPTETADEVVSRHIDQNCEIKRDKVYKNACSVTLCKKRELMPLVCENCGSNHCLAHRHPKDHNCPGPGRCSTTTNTASRGPFKMIAQRGVGYLSNIVSVNGLNSSTGSSTATANARASRNAKVNVLQGDLSEEDALQIALAESLNATSSTSSDDKNKSCKIN